MRQVSRNGDQSSQWIAEGGTQNIPHSNHSTYQSSSIQVIRMFFTPFGVCIQKRFYTQPMGFVWFWSTFLLPKGFWEVFQSCSISPVRNLSNHPSIPSNQHMFFFFTIWCRIQSRSSPVLSVTHRPVFAPASRRHSLRTNCRPSNPSGAEVSDRGGGQGPERVGFWKPSFKLRTGALLVVTRSY